MKIVGFCISVHGQLQVDLMEISFPVKMYEQQVLWHFHQELTVWLLNESKHRFFSLYQKYT